MAKKKCRSIIAALVVAMTVSFGGVAWATAVVSGLVFYEQVSATDVNTTVTFSAAGRNLYADSVTVYNSGANEIYINIDAAATTSKILIASGATWSVNGKAAQIGSLGIICSTGETATVEVHATLLQ